MRKPAAEMYATLGMLSRVVTAILSRNEKNEGFDARRLALLLPLDSTERVR